MQRLRGNVEREAPRSKQGPGESAGDAKKGATGETKGKEAATSGERGGGSKQAEGREMKVAKRDDCRKRKVASPEPERTKRLKKTTQPGNVEIENMKSKIFPRVSSKPGQHCEEVLDDAKILAPETALVFPDTALPEAPVPESVALLGEGGRILEDDLVLASDCPLQTIVEEQIFPGPAGLVRRSIPETPEKEGALMPAPDPDLLCGIKKLSPPTSPVIKPAAGKGKERSRSKLRLSTRANNGEMDRKMFAKKSLASQEDGQELLVTHQAKEERDTTKKVGKMAPALQSEVDKKAFQDLQRDFPDQKYWKDQHESDSDFESPNLLARKPRRGNKETLRREGSVKLREKEEEVKEGRLYAEDKEEDIESIENPNSSVELLETEKEKKIETFVSPMKKQKSVTKSTNRWGMEVNPITDSQKKRLRNQKQVREFYPIMHTFTLNLSGQNCRLLQEPSLQSKQWWR